MQSSQDSSFEASFGIVIGLAIADGSSGQKFSTSVVAYTVVSLLWVSAFGVPTHCFIKCGYEKMSNALLVETLGTKVCKGMLLRSKIRLRLGRASKVLEGLSLVTIQLAVIVASDISINQTVLSIYVDFIAVRPIKQDVLLMTLKKAVMI